MYQENDIQFFGWEGFENDHTLYVRKEVNQREIESTKAYLVDMVNDFKLLNEEVIKDTIYPPPGIMKEGAYAEFHFQFEFNSKLPKVIYRGFDLTEDE